MSIHDDIDHILITEDQIKVRIAELGEILATEYADKNPLFVGVLRGVVVFFADMIRAVPIPCQIDFMSVSSYGNSTVSSNNITISKDLSIDVKDRHVVILEDILDTGRTLAAVCGLLEHRGAASLKVCTLLDKPERRVVDITADYTGFTIPNEFVVGYGLDYADQYRNLPYVGVLKPEIYM